MSYIAARQMKVQVAPGKVEVRRPGEPVPEAEDWVNVGAYVRRGYLTHDGNKDLTYDRRKLKPSVVADDAARARGAAPGVTPAPLPPPLPTPVPTTGPAADLMLLNRGDLDSLALEHGVERPERMANKLLVVQALLAKQSAG